MIALDDLNTINALIEKKDYKQAFVKSQPMLAEDDSSGSNGNILIFYNNYLHLCFY